MRPAPQPAYRSHFYPRPPRGGRPDSRRAGFTRTRISIHALREEGDITCARDAIAPSNFYPRPPRGGRHTTSHRPYHQEPISIHALREEGDFRPHWPQAAKYRFLSTPSARRATATFLYTCTFNLISIHALREEGDSTAKSKRFKHCNFYPRPPRGGRRGRLLFRSRSALFLSTPSARRATADRSVPFP